SGHRRTARRPYGGGMITNEPTVVDVEQLRRGQSFSFVGADHGGVPLCIILDRSEPGQGPALHRHPYDEVWVLEEGTAVFVAGERWRRAVRAPIAAAPAGTPHRFTNTGATPLRMTCIHPRGRFETEWL